MAHDDRVEPFVPPLCANKEQDAVFIINCLLLCTRPGVHVLSVAWRLPKSLGSLLPSLLHCRIFFFFFLFSVLLRSAERASVCASMTATCWYHLQRAGGGAVLAALRGTPPSLNVAVEEAGESALLCLTPRSPPVCSKTQRAPIQYISRAGRALPESLINKEDLLPSACLPSFCSGFPWNSALLWTATAFKGPIWPQKIADGADSCQNKQKKKRNHYWPDKEPDKCRNERRISSTTEMLVFSCADYEDRLKIMPDRHWGPMIAEARQPIANRWHHRSPSSNSCSSGNVTHALCRKSRFDASAKVLWTELQPSVFRSGPCDPLYIFKCVAEMPNVARTNTIS